MPAMIAINVWKLFPFVAIMVLAGLQSIPQELYEAARVDGASFWDEVRHVMLPQIRPVIAAVTLLLVIWGAQLPSPSSTPSPAAGRPTGR